MSFDKPHRGKVGYFGHWSDELAEVKGAEDALNVLQKAGARCHLEDVRQTPRLDEALAYLETMGIKPGYLKGFRRALDIENGDQRYAEVQKAYQRITKHL